MHVDIEGSPAFSHLKVRLDPGESLLTESGAMASMSGKIDMAVTFFGSFLQAFLRSIFGGESLFTNRFTNPTNAPQTLVVTQAIPGEIRAQTLAGDSLCLEPGSFVAATEGVRLSLRWAGLASWFGGEGLFKLQASGNGTLWFGAYGAMVVRAIDGEVLVDTGHLVAYTPGLKLGVRLSGGVFSSFFGGEGFVTRVQGRGTLVLQSRSLKGLAHWLNRQF